MLDQFKDYPYSERAYIYANHVVKGHRPACFEERAACQRFLDDLVREDFKFTYKFEFAENVCGFIEQLPHTKGAWASRKELITLEGWQCFILCNLFGWVDANDKRRFDDAYIKVARKNGKSLLCAAIGIYMLAVDGEHGAEVYYGATTERQADECFIPAKEICKNTPDLCQAFGIEVNARTIVVQHNASKMERMIGKPGDGSSPHFSVHDEYHEHDTNDQCATMATGMLAREQPLQLKITTAGNNTAGPCYMAEQEYKKLLGGIYKNERQFAVIFGIDPDDDWTTEEALVKANPNLGVSVDADRLREKQLEAIRNPAEQNDFKRKHLDVWVGSLDAFINMESYAKCVDADMRIEDFRGESCVYSLDLASKLDLTASLKVFRKDIDTQIHYYVFTKFYMCEETIYDPKNAHYQAWKNAGYLTQTDGDEIDYNVIRMDIENDLAVIRADEVVYDEYRAAQLAQQLRSDGVSTVEYRNTVPNMSPPMRELEAAVQAQRLHVDDNPIMAWCAENLVAKEDPNRNVFPEKEKPENKIDGAVALIMAIGRLMYTNDTGLSDFLNEATR